MNLEDTVYYGCAAWASIHPNRAATLNHLFLVIGNGYEWIDGELLEVCGETTYKNGKRMSLNAAINNVFRRRRVHNAASARHRRNWNRSKEGRKIAKDVDRRVDADVDAIIKAERLLREKDPTAYDEKRRKQDEEFAALRKQWRDDKKWEYRVPVNVEERIRTTAGYNRWYPICERYSAIFTFPEDIKLNWLDGIIETCNLVIAQPPTPDRNSPQQQCDKTVTLAKKALAGAIAFKRSKFPFVV